MNFLEAVEVLKNHDEELRINGVSALEEKAKEAIAVIVAEAGISEEFISERYEFDGTETVDLLQAEFLEWAEDAFREEEEEEYFPYEEEEINDYWSFPDWPDTDLIYEQGDPEDYDYTADDRNFDAANGR